MIGASRTSEYMSFGIKWSRRTAIFLRQLLLMLLNRTITPNILQVIHRAAGDLPVV